MQTIYCKYTAVAKETLLSYRDVLAGPAKYDYKKIQEIVNFEERLQGLETFYANYNKAFTAFNKNIDLKYNFLRIFILLSEAQDALAEKIIFEIGFNEEEKSYLKKQILEFGFPEYIDFFQNYELEIALPVLDITMRPKQQQGLTLAEMNLLADLPENDTRLEVKASKKQEEMLWRARIVDYKKMEEKYLASGYKMLAQCLADLVAEVAQTRFRNFRKYIG